MLRAILLIAAAALLAVWIAPSWNSGERTLSLRVRGPDEIRAALRRSARLLGERMVRAGDDEKAPPVAAGPTRDAPPKERLTQEDRARLDKLVEDKLRDE